MAITHILVYIFRGVGFLVHSLLGVVAIKKHLINDTYYFSLDSALLCSIYLTNDPAAILITYLVQSSVLYYYYPYYWYWLIFTEQKKLHTLRLKNKHSCSVPPYSPLSWWCHQPQAPSPDCAASCFVFHLRLCPRESYLLVCLFALLCLFALFLLLYTTTLTLFLVNVAGFLLCVYYIAPSISAVPTHTHMSLNVLEVYLKYATVRYLYRPFLVSFSSFRFLRSLSVSLSLSLSIPLLCAGRCVPLASHV